MKTNKNGVKLLAAILVLAVALAGVVILPTSDADATPTDSTLDAAGSYDYDGDYTRVGTITISKNDNIVDATYTLTQVKKNAGYGVLADFARLVGALDWANAEETVTVTSITYNDVVYTWQPEKAGADRDPQTLLGSNWYNNTEGTLVSTVFDGADITADTPTLPPQEIKLTVTKSDDTTYEMTYNIITSVGTLDDLKEVIGAKSTKITLSTGITNTGESTITIDYPLEIIGSNKLTNEGTVILPAGEDNTNALTVPTWIVNSKIIGGPGWTYDSTASGETLTLNNYDGKQYFLGKITEVKLEGTNVITASTSGESFKDGKIGLIANQTYDGKMIIQKGEANGTLTINQLYNEGYGISHHFSKNSVGAITVKNVDITVSAGCNRAIYGSTLIFGDGDGTDNTTFTAYGSEKAIRATDDIDIYSDATVYAYLNDPLRANGSGADDFFGIKADNDGTADGDTITVAGTLITQGLFADLLDNTGKIIVTTDYVQKAGAVKGIHILGDSEIEVKRVDSASDATSNGTYIVGDGLACGPKITVNTGSSVSESTATSSETLAEELAKDGIETVTLVISDEYTPSGTPITIGAGKSVNVIISGNNSINETFKNDENEVTLTNVKGQFTISQGSIYINGTIYSGTIDVSGDIEISGEITEEVTLNVVGDTKITFINGDNPSVDISGILNIVNDNGESVSIFIGEGDILNITGELNLESGVKMNNDGQIIGGGTIDVPEGAQFYTSNPVSINFTGEGKIILEDAIETLKLSDKLASSMTTEPTQKVIVTGNLTIKKNQELVITGDLEIPEGVIVTIENGGQLRLTSPTATANIAGTIKSLGEYTTDVAGFKIDRDVTGDVIVTGQIIAGKTEDNQISVDIEGKSQLEGTITVSAKAIANFGRLYVADVGSVTVKGTIGGTIYNQGSVVIDGAVDNATIYNQATTATVQIESLASGTLTISDKGLYLQTIDSTRYYVTDMDGNDAADLEHYGVSIVYNEITFQNVKGITITESIAYTTLSNGERRAVNHMEIQGSISISNSKESPSAPEVTVTNGTIDAIGELTISKALLVIEDNMVVDGKIYVDDAEMPNSLGFSSGITVNGELTVNGLVRTVEETITGEDNVNAVKYEQKVDTKDVYYYTNLADAIASGVKDLEVLGDLKILKDTTIPAGIEIDASNSTITIGKASKTEVTLTVADGGYLAFDGVVVYGTFYIENTDDGVNKMNSIISDTSVITETTAMYTNLLNALNNAESGEVRITKGDDRTVTLTSDATVRKDVKLIVPTLSKLVIKNGVTLTVEGTLDLKGELEDSKATGATKAYGFYTETYIASEPSILYSVVKVTGTVISANYLEYGEEPIDNNTNPNYGMTTGYHIPGAYYELKGMYYITTIDQAAPIIKTVDGAELNIWGENKVGTVAFEGTSMIPVIVNVHGDITAESMTVKFGTVAFDNEVMLNGTFGSSVGTIDVAGMIVETGLSIEDTVVTINDVEVQKVIIGGTIGSDADSKTKAYVIFNGAVEISKANLVISTEYTTTSGSAYGDIVIAEGSIVTVVGKELQADSSAEIIVDGELITKADGCVKADALVVMGTLDIKEKSGSTNAGRIAVDNLYIGGTTEDVAAVGNAAAVNAPASGIGAVYLFPGSTVTGTLSVALESEDAVFTEFYVEDVLWLTVYDINGTVNLEIAYEDTVGTNTYMVYNFKPLKIKEKEFVSWQFMDNEKLTNVEDGDVVGTYDKVYAKIKYDVYNIIVYACEGIDDVFIDGNLMKFSQVSSGNGDVTATMGMFVASVVAGEHTISYTLTNGYSGTATMLLNDEKVTGYKFTTSGNDFKTESYDIILQGIEKSGYVPESPDVPAPTEPTEDEGLGITEYLLIVLVVLAAILVVVVAIRMMRS